ncbi:MAG: GNAT family N-acetyltransferase [Planctomycetes bacterium]|nr:GNAT family N-acetyltransferase [Planctomycetota bacterium]
MPALICYRAFRNNDPPGLVDIWRSQVPVRHLMQPMTLQIFSQLVLAKPYFEREGLIVALQDHKPVGFVHAGFGPSDDRRGPSHEVGVVCMLMVRPHDEEAAIRDELLSRAEQYLVDRGARTILGGAGGSYRPFYLGLYGGSDMPGVLDEDRPTRQAYLARDYAEEEQVLIFQRDLSSFRAPVDRRQRELRRSVSMTVEIDPPVRNWWEACTWGCFDRKRLSIQSRADGQTLASATFWTMDGFSTSWGVHAEGLAEVTVDPGATRQGLATCLLGEAMRRLHDQGISLIEAHAPADHVALIGLCQKLGFEQVGRGTQFRKTQ